ncbi:hypothetical protein BBP00_00003329 [Phytophthora kernoviae]|uniref:protein-L-isoaspartate(D-aspartate) O-methyltransferase n=1 Tax=Phytophthora kernoviae TaxID=325452 RepID=A0A3F2RWJ5_9STRA|nr:hypothetical protein BBP00_00003329 [Phytophthora kernoviae]
MSFWPHNPTDMAGLISHLRSKGVVRSEAVANAMVRTDRAKYMAQIETPDGEHVGHLEAYQDSPHPIGYHQTISAPHMHAHAMELGYAAIKDVNKPCILDVGSGSGYLTACLGRLVEEKHGRVFGLEILPGLVQFSKKNIQVADGDLLDNGIVSVHCHNGWDGLPNEVPFHYIHVGAAAETPPQALLDQLAEGGRMVLPLDEPRGGQMFVEITRHGSCFSQRRLFGVCYVPLVRERVQIKTMALSMLRWPCSSTSNEGLIQNMVKTGVVHTVAVADAMKRTDRACFVPRTLQEDAYQDSPCPIGFNQIISAPHTHAHVLELAHTTLMGVIKPRVLDIGAGSGYLTAALARLVDDAGGRVFGLELLPALTQFARKNVLHAAADLLERGVISLHCHNGWNGLPSEGPFNFIFVGAAVSSPPQMLLDQLADGGQLVVPVDDPRGGQALVSVMRHGSSFVRRKIMPACFVPLIRGEVAKKRRGLGVAGDTEPPVTKTLRATYSFRAVR